MSAPAPKFTFHLLPNAHIDPVWLWDWREGLNEGLITVRTVLDLMDEFPELTFMRGESAIYEHIQRTDPAMFGRILDRIHEGRWDVVGGTVIQPDTNLVSTEVLCREFERGLDYFQKTIGVRPTVAWLADSFGHTPGLPNIFSAFGMEGFCFTRPERHIFPLESPAFWWEGDWNNRILCYRQHWGAYCNERDQMIEVLDKTLSGAAKMDFVNVGILMGLGNHGGGPTRRHLHEIEQWGRQHPEVQLKFSTLHGLFASLKSEVASNKSVPAVRGDFGFCLRGCYSSMQRFKSLYRGAESQVAEADITRSLIGSIAGVETMSLVEAWDALLFNAFHDIVPGSSIERAFEEQADWVGLARHRAREAKFAALNHLAAKVDTSVPPARKPDVATDVPVLIWNSLPRAFAGMVEAEVQLDWRQIWKFRGTPDQIPLVAFDHVGRQVPFQVVQTEHIFMEEVPWRRRLLVPVEIPALGWTMIRIGWRDEPEAAPAAGDAAAVGDTRISNGTWEVEAAGDALQIRRNGSDHFLPGRNMEVRLVEDHSGSWGAFEGNAESVCFEQLREKWSLSQSKVLERGPLRSKMWTRWKGANSWMDLTFAVESGSSQIKVAGRMLFNERSARLKLVLPCEGAVEFDVPAGKATRDAIGQLPGGRWVVRANAHGAVGFASDVFSDFDATPDELRVTLVRATRYANAEMTRPDERMWQPAMDCGELKFQFCLFDGQSNPDSVADSILFQPTAMPAPPSKGDWPREGSLAALSPHTMRLLSIEQTGPDNLKVRVQNRASTASPAHLTLGDTRHDLGMLEPQQIKTYVLAAGSFQPS